MPIALVTGPANAGKANAVLEAVRAHVAHGENPLLVVPTRADQARYRRELAEGGVALGARVERFEGLLGEIVARAGLAEAPLGRLARERLLARIADARPGLAIALARIVAELETQRVTPARLRGALRTWGSAARASDRERSRASGLAGDGGGEGRDAPATLERVCEVYDAYHRTLAKMRRADRELRVTRALDALRREPARWEAMPVLLYGFDDLTELQLDAIETLGGVVGARLTLSLAYESGRLVFAGRAGAFQRLRPLADAHTELPARAEHYGDGSREALHHLERSLLTDDPARVEPGDAVRLLEGGSPRAELELVAGEVRALLDAGVKPSEIAIAHRSPEKVAGPLCEVLAAFDIPHAMRERVKFADTAIGRGLLGLMRCAVTGGKLGDLLAWLRVPGVLDRPELADRLEASARRSGALDAARARALWEAERWPLDRIDRVAEAAAAGTSALVDVLAGELERLFRAPRRAAAAVLARDELYEARALTTGRRALEELREAARGAPEHACTAAELVDVLERLELDGGEWPDPDRVAIVDPLSLRARRVRMVFACGMQEGVFPAPTSPHPLLTEEHRRRLAESSGLVLRGEPDALAAERYLLYALVSRPEERLTLSWHVAGEDGTPLAPSLFLDDIRDLFEPTLRERTRRRHAGAAGWPGPGKPAGTMIAREAAMLSRAHGGVGEAAPALASRPSTVGFTSAASTGAPPPTIEPLRHEGVLGELSERALWSASSLESWTACPVKWFVERLLRVEDIDPDPEPIARGALTHAALKRTLDALRERTGSARLTPASVGAAKRLLRDALAELEPLHPLTRAPERLPGARRRLAVDLERYLDYAAEQESPLEPTHLELGFGFGDGDLPPLDLGDGVMLRGRIDRVDTGSAGEAVVYDYKGRAAPPGARWASDGAFQVALYMRAIERLLDLRVAGGFYQPLAGRDIKARGVLDTDSGVEIDAVRTDRLERVRVEEVLEACLGAARTAAGEARAGALRPRPDTCAYNGGCSYPTICRCER
ncbi:MAG TPA: PD-(D/E)XK nuclease family protein [Solirubrobacteraceae bacterium]